VPRASYNENWFFTKNKRTFNPDTVITRRVVLDNLGIPTDSIAEDIAFGTVTKSIVYGFTPLRDFDAGVNINTQIYGTMNFKKGYLRALRHVIRPTIGYTFSPDNSNRWLRDSVRFDSRDIRKYQHYGYLDNMPYSVFSHSRQETINFGFSNVLEAKVKSRRDSTGELRKVPLISNLSINSNYNFAADSLRMGFVSMNGTTNLFKMINLTVSARFDPYKSSQGRRINRFAWDTDKKLLIFRSGSLNASTDIRPEKLLGLFTKQNNDKPNTKTRPTKGVIQNMYVSYNLNIENRHNSERNKDTLMVTTNDISLNGNFHISNKWQINIGRIGYDFSRKRVTYPELSFSRNLHCWEMGMSWYPELHTYSFFLRVTPGSLDFLKIPFNKARYDGTDPFIIR